jgi:SDR family mycofactocin-dependent oxidoreductase
VIVGGGPVWELSDQEWDTLAEVNVTGVLNLVRAAVPLLLRMPSPRHGRFVAVTSAAAHRGLWGLGGYCAAKHAVLGLVRGLACDLRGTGVAAVAVSPGSTRTDMLRATADLYHLADPHEFAGQQLVDRLLEPAEVAEVVAWACSPAAAALTGSTLHAEGGFSG